MEVTWYFIPLALVISLVYSSSRYELPERVLRKSANLFIKIVIFMVAVFVLLFLLSFRL